MEAKNGIRSKCPVSGVQLNILARMENGWELETVGKAFHPLILQKGGIGSGLEKMCVSRSSVSGLLRKNLICMREEKPGVFFVTEIGHVVLRAYRNETK